MQRPSKKVALWFGVGIVALVLVVGGFIVGSNGNGYERVVVERRDLVDDVTIAGTVEAGTVADIGFEVSGRVVSVSVDEGDEVVQGQELVVLDTGTLHAELSSAQADVQIRSAELANSQTSLFEVRQQQDTLVESAYRSLLSEGLIAEPRSDAQTQTAPTLTGRYTGPEGVYKFRVVEKNINDSHEIRIFNLETPEPIAVNETGPTPLGSYGLFVSFPDALNTYADTTWHVTIPNNESSVYAENFNMYQEALRDRDKAIEEAQAQIKGQQTGSSIAQAQLQKAQAEVARIQAEIAKRALVAPFDGIITQVDVALGEIVSANTVAVSLISTDGFGIEIDLPEVDSIKVVSGDPAVVLLDAFGDERFGATVASVNRTETIVDNVAVYEARLVFDAEDGRVTSGMTADATITTDTRTGVLALPARTLRFREEDGAPFVFVEQGDDIVEVVVETGLRSSDGFVEIRGGVAEGDVVLIPTT